MNEEKEEAKAEEYVHVPLPPGAKDELRAIALDNGRNPGREAAQIIMRAIAAKKKRTEA